MELGEDYLQIYNLKDGEVYFKTSKKLKLITNQPKEYEVPTKFSKCRNGFPHKIKALASKYSEEDFSLVQ